MPDQNSAANEHALLEEITAPLSTLPEDPVLIVADVDFPVVLRGYDRLAVDAYVRRTSQLVAELQATRSPEAAVRRALERVGEQISGILQRAHETAAQITTQSRTEAEDRLEVARQEGERITAEARAQVRDLDAETDRIWAERQRIVDDARQLSQDLMRLADGAAERFPAATGDTGEGLPAEEEGEAPAAFAPPGAIGDELAGGYADAGLDEQETEVTGAMGDEAVVPYEEEPIHGSEPGSGGGPTPYGVDPEAAASGQAGHEPPEEPAEPATAVTPEPGNGEQTRGGEPQPTMAFEPVQEHGVEPSGRRRSPGGA